MKNQCGKYVLQRVNDKASWVDFIPEEEILFRLSVEKFFIYYLTSYKIVSLQMQIFENKIMSKYENLVNNVSKYYVKPSENAKNFESMLINSVISCNFEREKKPCFEFSIMNSQCFLYRLQNRETLKNV